MMMCSTKSVRGLCVSLCLEDIIPRVLCDIPLCDITGGQPHLRDIGINLE